MKMNNFETKKPVSTKKRETLKERAARQQLENDKLAAVAPTLSRRKTKIDVEPKPKTPRKKIERAPLSEIYELPTYQEDLNKKRFDEKILETTPVVDDDYGRLVDPNEDPNFIEKQYGIDNFEAIRQKLAEEVHAGNLTLVEDINPDSNGFDSRTEFFEKWREKEIKKERNEKMFKLKAESNDHQSMNNYKTSMTERTSRNFKVMNESKQQRNWRDKIGAWWDSVVDKLAEYADDEEDDIDFQKQTKEYALKQKQEQVDQQDVINYYKDKKDAEFKEEQRKQDDYTRYLVERDLGINKKTKKESPVEILEEVE